MSSTGRKSCEDCGSRLELDGTCPNCHEELFIATWQGEDFDGPYSDEFARKVEEQAEIVRSRGGAEVRLTELEPKWIHPNVLTFLCPHCRKDWLTCKNIVMRESEQFDLYEKVFGEDWNLMVVPCRPDTCWQISGNFENMSVMPSIDASNSGHWHGFISNGEIK